MVTTTMDGAERRGNRGLPRWMWWIIVFGVMLLVFYGAWRIGLKRAIARELAAIKAAGYPTTPGEMQAWYPPLPPEAENAAEAILEAVARLKQPKDVFGEEVMDARPWIDAGIKGISGEVGDEGPVMRLKSELVPLFGGVYGAGPGQVYPAECMELMGQYMKANEEAVEQLGAAGKIATSRYPADYGLGVRVKLPSLSNIRMACNLFALAAMDAEREYDSGRAARAITAQLNIAESMRDEPVLVTQLVRIACVGLSVNSLQRAVNRMSFDVKQLSGLEAALGGMESARGMRGVWIANCAMYHDMFGNPDIYAAWDFSPRKVPQVFYDVSGINDYCQLYFLRVMQKYRDIACMAEADQWGEAKKMDAEMESGVRRWMEPMVLVPPMGRAFLLHLRVVAQARCARGALAAQRFRLEHGKWPTNWGELVPGYLEKEPIDPFTGKVLMMKVADGVLTVYSVGEDLTDNGGVRLNGDGQMFGAGADVVFEIGR